VCRPTPIVIVIAIVIVPTVGERAREPDLRAASADWSADYVVDVGDAGSKATRSARLRPRPAK
jgi:hypothetical protein